MIKKVIRSIAYHSGLTSSIAKHKSYMAIIMIHGVGGRELSINSFYEQMKYLKRKHNVVPLDNIIKKLDEKNSNYKGEISLTFDDGLKNNIDFAYPILKDLNLPATFYICPGLIESEKWLWNIEMRLRLESLDKISIKKLARELIGNHGYIENIIEWMKNLEYKKRLQIEEMIRKITTEFSPNKEQNRQYDIMKWHDLKKIDFKLITIGAHTMTHPILSRIPDDIMKYEICECKNVIEKKLNYKVKHFCYPNGNYDMRAYEYVKNNYISAVTTNADIIRNNYNKFDLPRISIANDESLLSWRIVRPTA